VRRAVDRNGLVDGAWKTDIEPYTDESGAFDRTGTPSATGYGTRDGRFRPSAFERTDRVHAGAEQEPYRPDVDSASHSTQQLIVDVSRRNA